MMSIELLSLLQDIVLTMSQSRDISQERIEELLHTLSTIIKENT